MRPVLDVIELLRHKGADVRFHNPYVPIIRHNGFEMAGEVDLDAAYSNSKSNSAETVILSGFTTQLLLRRASSEESPCREARLFAGSAP